MRILDKTKEFYDYVVSKYGIDNQIILDRRNKEEHYFPDDIHNWIFNYLWNTSLHFVLEVGYVQYLFQVDYVEGKIQNVNIVKIFESACQIIDYQREFWSAHKIKTTYKFKVRKDLISCVTNFYNVEPLHRAINHKEVTIYTLRFDQLSNMSVRKNKEYVNLNPFAKFLDPEEVYQQIYNYLISKKDIKIEDIRSDVQKLESKGFDKKTSFRNL